MQFFIEVLVGGPIFFLSMMLGLKEGLRLYTATFYWGLNSEQLRLFVIGMTSPMPHPRRRFAYACMDWSERRDHLAGQLATELLGHFVGKGWLRRRPDRVVEVTPPGARELLSTI